MIHQSMPIKYENDCLYLLDQRKLPASEIFIECNTLEDGYTGIKDMIVRGAPCIGFTGIFSLALWLKNNEFDLAEFNKACDYLKSARPTAVNLAFEINKVQELVNSAQGPKSSIYKQIVDYGYEQIESSEKNNRAMARFAEKELDSKLGKNKYKIMTHCNTGFLACGSIGTALGVIQHLHEQNKLEMAWLDETRPYFQGSRLSAFELSKLEAPHNIVVEGAMSLLMSNQKVDAIFVGADRIAANGDTANKIGTSTLAIVAKYYDIPFYVVAPSSSFDLSIPSGEKIEIELRDEKEILSLGDYRIAPKQSQAYNPSFDITKGELISGIINERGIARSQYSSSLRELIL